MKRGRSVQLQLLATPLSLRRGKTLLVLTYCPVGEKIGDGQLLSENWVFELKLWQERRHRGGVPVHLFLGHQFTDDRRSECLGQRSDG